MQKIGEIRSSDSGVYLQHLQHCDSQFTPPDTTQLDRRRVGRCELAMIRDF